MPKKSAYTRSIQEISDCYFNIILEKKLFAALPLISHIDTTLVLILFLYKTIFSKNPEAISPAFCF